MWTWICKYHKTYFYEIPLKLNKNWCANRFSKFLKSETFLKVGFIQPGPELKTYRIRVDRPTSPRNPCRPWCTAVSYVPSWPSSCLMGPRTVAWPWSSVPSCANGSRKTWRTGNGSGRSEEFARRRPPPHCTHRWTVACCWRPCWRSCTAWARPTRGSCCASGSSTRPRPSKRASWFTRPGCEFWNILCGRLVNLVLVSRVILQMFFVNLQIRLLVCQLVKFMCIPVLPGQCKLHWNQCNFALFSANFLISVFSVIFRVFSNWN